MEDIELIKGSIFFFEKGIGNKELFTILIQVSSAQVQIFTRVKGVIIYSFCNLKGRRL